jgi:hypothetical protein
MSLLSDPTADGRVPASPLDASPALCARDRLRGSGLWERAVDAACQRTRAAVLRREASLQPTAFFACTDTV